MTPEIAKRLRAVEDALAAFRPECQSCDVVDIPKLRLADAVLDAVRAELPQKARAAKVLSVRSRARKRA